MVMMKSSYTESELADAGWKFAFSMNCSRCGERLAVYELFSSPRRKLYLTEGTLYVHEMECRGYK